MNFAMSGWNKKRTTTRVDTKLLVKFLGFLCLNLCNVKYIDQKMKDPEAAINGTNAIKISFK